MYCIKTPNIIPVGLLLQLMDFRSMIGSSGHNNINQHWTSSGRNDNLLLQLCSISSDSDSYFISDICCRDETFAGNKINCPVYLTLIRPSIRPGDILYLQYPNSDILPPSAT